MEVRVSPWPAWKELCQERQDHRGRSQGCLRNQMRFHLSSATSCGTLGTWLPLSSPRSPHPHTRDRNGTHSLL